MEKNKTTISLLKDLLFRPQEIIKSTDLINYNMEDLRKVYYLSALGLAIVGALRAPEINTPVMWIFVIMGYLMLALIQVVLVTFGYYVVMKLIGRMKVSYEIIKRAFYPVIAVEFIVVYFLEAATNSGLILSIAKLIMGIWFIYVAYSIIKYKFGQSGKKSFLLTITKLGAEYALLKFVAYLGKVAIEQGLA